MGRAEAIGRIRALPRGRRRRWLAFALGGVALVTFDALAHWSAAHVLLVNASVTLPNWAFLIDRERVPTRGDLVFFDPPASALLQRNFGAELKPFGKLVYGVGGDVVTREGRLFLVSGRAVALAKQLTRRGEPLALGPIGVIPRGCYFVATPHKDGFDSRYAAIGWICRPRIIGVGEAIL